MNPFDIVVEYWPRLLDGTLMTLKLTFLGAFIAAPQRIWCDDV